MPRTGATLIDTIYDRFKARDVDGVLARLSPDFRWATRCAPIGGGSGMS